jgi:hypothetical protein
MRAELPKRVLLEWYLGVAALNLRRGKVHLCAMVPLVVLF